MKKSITRMLWIVAMMLVPALSAWADAAYVDIPGTLKWTDITCVGGCKWEGGGANIGYMRHGVG